MSQRVSYSWLDPWITRPIKGTYRRLAIPARVPPEAIVACGHGAAVAGAAGFACSSSAVWGGVLAALGVALNHACDVLDGTHARATSQCRNGGELLDHFVDPLSFSYWAAGLAYAAAAHAPWAPWLGMAGIIVIYATAVLTNIRAKMIGQFTLARFGPTEFKTLLALLGATLAALTASPAARFAGPTACWFLAGLTAAGAVQLVVSLRRAVDDVNACDAAPADTTEWELSGNVLGDERRG